MDRVSLFVLPGHNELMRLLIYSGFNPHQLDNFSQSPLHLSCINGNLSAVKDLCEVVGLVCLFVVNSHAVTFLVK